MIAHSISRATDIARGSSSVIISPLMTPEANFSQGLDVLNHKEVEPISVRAATVLEPHGMCGGVVAAVNFTESLLKKVAGREPVYAFNQIVHNHAINKRFEMLGLKVSEKKPDGDWPYDAVPPESLCLLPAHGHKPEDLKILELKGCIIFTTACSLVKKEWKEVRDAAESGKKILLFGKKDHPEPRGTMAQVPEDSIVLVSSARDIENFVSGPNFNPENDYVMANQTTISIRDIRDVRKRAIELIVNLDVNDRRGGCYATDNRQKAAEVFLAEQGGHALLVVGSGDISHNTYNLAKVAWDLKKPAWIVNGPEEIDWSWFLPSSGIEKLGVSSGASCAEEDFLSVVDALVRKNIDVEYQMPAAREKKTEFPIDGVKKLHLLDERYANWPVFNKV